jgi:hypothetical protein
MVDGGHAAARQTSSVVTKFPPENFLSISVEFLEVKM